MWEGRWITAQPDDGEKMQEGITIQKRDIVVNTGGAFALAGGLLVFVVAWAVLGFGAFVMSLVCFSKKGTGDGNVVGLLLAILLGPFYWLYYLGSGTYCKGIPAK
jgi:hypothetical protein